MDVSSPLCSAALQEQLPQVPGGSSAPACDVQLSVLPARAGEPLLANQSPFQIKSWVFECNHSVVMQFLVLQCDPSPLPGMHKGFFFLVWLQLLKHSSLCSMRKRGWGRTQEMQITTWKRNWAWEDDDDRLFSLWGCDQLNWDSSSGCVFEDVWQQGPSGHIEKDVDRDLFALHNYLFSLLRTGASCSPWFPVQICIGEERKWGKRWIWQGTTLHLSIGNQDPSVSEGLWRFKAVPCSF